MHFTSRTPKTALLIGLFLLFFMFPFLLFSQDSTDQNQEDNLKISLMTIGPGSDLNLWWGHIGLVVEERGSDRHSFFDFGNFDPSMDNFFKNFALGRLYSFSGVASPQRYLNFISYYNRSVTIYELNLTPQEKKRLHNFLLEGIRPENQGYLYHHYEDNCATRVRDGIDVALSGRLRESSESYAFSYRAQSNRFMKNFWAYMLLNYLQGPSVDKPIDQYDSQFLPYQLERMLETMDGTNGEPLVTTKILFQEEVGGLTIPDKPYPWFSVAFLWGMIFFFLSLCFRLYGGFLFSLWRTFAVLMTALPSFLLYFMMFFTDHILTRGNLNGLVTFPLIILALIPSIKYNKGEAYARLFHNMWDYQAILVVIALSIQVIPQVTQDNLSFTLLYLPLYLGLGRVGTVMINQIQRFKGPYKWSQNL